VVLILTHRGLEPNKNDFFSEGSFEAFEDQLNRRFGIEFDPNFAKDGIIVFHDSSLKRITRGENERNFSEMKLAEIKGIGLEKGRIAELAEILQLIKKSKSKLNALHLKGIYQNGKNIDSIIKEIEKYGVIDKILLFDIKPEFAEYIKLKNDKIKLAPSVAHEYDIKRYNQFVGGTLISIEDTLKYKKENLYDWAWLDEWDTLDEKGGEKRLSTRENFDKLRKVGYKIATITPELHGTSPGLYGGESHKDAVNKDVLFKRIKELIELEPDAICTDYPEEVREMIERE
jgi:glycerophosphoryl diester phosphodiesterase